MKETGSDRLHEKKSEYLENIRKSERKEIFESRRKMVTQRCENVLYDRNAVNGDDCRGFRSLQSSKRRCRMRGCVRPVEYSEN